jgi:trans-2,3-dihydro-3-hydroxyanthranilate isomerase
MLVDACIRGSAGGSPTVVLPADPSMSDAERCEVPKRFGTSHAVFVHGRELRFFTSAGELPACGHGTVAALAYLSVHTGRTDFQLRASGRAFSGRVDRAGDRIRAFFDPGPITVRLPAPGEVQAVAGALGLDEVEGCVVAMLGRPRMLVPVPSAAALSPDLDRLRAACDAFGMLGCYAYSKAGDRVTARMFAPSIGVPEDIANANSTACLAAHLNSDLTVDMGDTLGHPATIIATVHPALRVGGVAIVA